MEELNDENKGFIEVEEINVIMKIPKNSVHLSLTASVIGDDGNLTKVQKTIGLDEILNMRSQFLNNVEDGDDFDVRYVVTEKGLEWLRQLENERNDEVHSVCN